MKTTKKNKLASAILGTALMGTASIAGMNGSCGAMMKKDEAKMMKKGSCGAMMKKGSCGAMMKKEDSNASKEMGTMSGNSGKKTMASCGAGKCGSM